MVDSRQHREDWQNAAVDDVQKPREALALTSNTTPSVFAEKQPHIGKL